MEDMKKELQWYSNYLGKKFFKHFCGLIGRKEWFDEFVKLKVDCNKTTLVFCRDEDKLKKFITFFLILKYRDFVVEGMYDFASDMTHRDNEDFIEKELTILYNHRHENLLGNSENWLLTTILNKVASRNREEKLTLVATERELPMLAESGEFQYIALEGSPKTVSTTTPVVTKGAED